MIHLKKAFLFIVLVSISGSNMYGFWPIFSSKFKTFGDDTGKRYYHVNSFPALLPGIRKITCYGNRTLTKTTIDYKLDTNTVFVKSNIALWTLGLGATTVAAWYKRDAIATGLEKLATLIKKK